MSDYLFKLCKSTTYQGKEACIKIKNFLGVEMAQEELQNKAAPNSGKNDSLPSHPLINLGVKLDLTLLQTAVKISGLQIRLSQLYSNLV